MADPIDLSVLSGDPLARLTSIQNLTDDQLLAQLTANKPGITNDPSFPFGQLQQELDRRTGGLSTLPSASISPSTPSPFGVADRKTADPANSNLTSAMISTVSGRVGGDLRIRLSAQIAAQEQVYGKQQDPNNILRILYETTGMLFPYTPTIAITQPVDYRALEMIHTNQDFYYYGRTPSLEINVTGDFTVQNYREGQYALACLHFLRTVSKMYFGKIDITNAGLPPPVLIFNGYGNYMFNNLRVLVKTHNYTFDKNVDSIDVKTASGVARIPALFQISVGLVVQNTPNRQRNEFDLNKFRTGEMMRSNTGWI